MQAYGIPYPHFKEQWSRSQWVRLMAVWNDPPAKPRGGMKISDLIGRR